MQSASPTAESGSTSDDEEFVHGKLSRLLTMAATAIALLTAIVPTLFYGAYIYSRTAHEMDARLDFQTRVVDQFIQQQPDYWEDNSARLQAILTPFVLTGDYFRLRNADGETIFEGGAKLTWYTQLRRHPVHAFGRPVGSLEVGFSQRQPLLAGSAILLFSSLIAWLIWGPGRRLPLVALYRAEQRLREHQQLLEREVAARTAELNSNIRELRFVKTSVDEAPIGITWVQPEDGKLVYANHRFEALSGYSLGDLLQKRVFDLDPTFPEASWPQHLQAAHHGEVTLDGALASAGGNCLPMEISVRLVTGDDGTERLVAFHIDQTQRRRMERISHLNEQRLETLWELTNFSASHDEAELMLRAVAAVAKLASAARVWLALYDDSDTVLAAYVWENGTAAVQDITASCSQCCLPVNQHFTPAGWAQASSRVETCLNRSSIPVMPGFPDKRPMPAQSGGEGRELSVPVYRNKKLRLLSHIKRNDTDFEEGSTEQLYLIAEDIWSIVHRLRTEAALEQARRNAESANRAKSAFLANMSHELRTPLNAMLGHAQILQRDPQLSTAQRTSVEIVRRSGDHLLTLINDILDLAKIEAGRLDIAAAPCDLFALLHGLEELFQVRCAEKGLGFSYLPAPGLPRRVEADERRLRQILMNLLGNAVKFTEQGDITLRADYADGSLKLSVTDTGIGIPAGRIERLFRPFQQEGDVEYRNQGTGLGLAISRSLAEQMNGGIEVESRPGIGSRFELRIPVPALPELPQEARTTASPTDRVVGYRRRDKAETPLRLLAVDDNADNLRVLHGLLDPLGFQVADADSGEAAVAAAAQTPLDLVLMDLVMPGINGLEATRRLLALPDLHDLPVVACSASAFETDRANSRAAGCAGHLAKPVQRDALLQELAIHLPIEWCFERQTEATHCGTEVPIESGLLEALLELTRRGKIQTIRDQLADLPDADRGLLPALRQAASQFDLKRLRHLLNEALLGKSA